MYCGVLRGLDGAATVCVVGAAGALWLWPEAAVRHDADERERLETILRDFGCDLSKWHELWDLYSYLRNDPSVENVCKAEGRPSVNITIANVTMLRSNLGCDEAVSLFRTSCSSAPTLRRRGR